MLKQDRKVKDQAILRNVEKEVRRKKEIKPYLGVGNSSVGSIHDCNRKTFERMLRAYWDKLYVGWNPYKNEGRGCWEVWQEPIKKTPVLQYEESDGTKIYTLEYKPSDYLHWIADLDYLSYDFIEKLKKMDAWENKHLTAQADDEYEKFHEKMERQEDEHLKYVVRHNKKAFRDLLDYVQAGYEPTQFFTKKV